jgi:hypothetical protein
MYIDELRRATLNLDPEIGRWMIRALDSDWFRVEPGAYEHGGPGGTVCPIVAAATMAGAWSHGQLLPGNPVWGTPDRPTTQVEEFAAYFDLCAEDSGTATAIRTVRRALAAVLGSRKLAA